jgi:hypothetical protein
MRNECKILIRNPEVKRPLRKPRHRWEDNIKVDWICLAQERDQWQAFVNMIMNLQIP